MPMMAVHAGELSQHMDVIADGGQIGPVATAGITDIEPDQARQQRKNDADLDVHGEFFQPFQTVQTAQ
jgi:hypothetical protein